MDLLPLFARQSGQHVAPVADLFSAIDGTMTRVEFDPQRTVVGANQRFLDCVGYTGPEIRGRNDSMFGDDSTRGRSRYRGLWNRRRADQLRAGESDRVGKGGRPLWPQATDDSLWGREGDVRGAIKLAGDSTEKMWLQEGHRTMHQRFFETVDSTAVRPSLADPDVRIASTNPASVDAIVGQSIERFHKKPQGQQGIRKSPRNLPHRAEMLGCSVSAFRDCDGHSMGPLVTWEVITEKARATRQLEEQSKQISAAAKEIAVFIKESTRRVREGDSRSSQVGRSSRTIVESVTRYVRDITAIASAAEQQAASTDEVKPAIRSVAQATEVSAASAGQLDAQLQRPRDLMRQLRA